MIFSYPPLAWRLFTTILVGVALCFMLGLVAVAHAQALPVGAGDAGVTQMGSSAIVSVTAAVVALTQLVKWQGVPDRLGPIAVLILAAVGVALWAVSTGGLGLHNAFDLFTGWITVAVSSAGVFGFTRAASTAVTATREPPPGAGASATAPFPLPGPPTG